jgi:NAD dependent epimerase/dehydratase family enzyme
MEKIRTLIVGASGLVGGEVLKCVSKENQEIFLLSRRTRGIVQENCSEIISDFDDIDNIDFPKVDHVYISIGKNWVQVSLCIFENLKEMILSR